MNDNQIYKEILEEQKYLQEYYEVEEQEKDEKREKCNKIYEELLEEQQYLQEHYEIKKQDMDELLNKLKKEAIKKYSYLPDYSEADELENEIFLEDDIEDNENNSIYIKSLKKRYENRIQDYNKRSKHIYMYVVYEELKNIFYSLKGYDDECKVDIIQLIEKLEKEMEENNIYNIKLKTINNLISDLKDLQGSIECIDFELEYNELDIFDSAIEEAYLIIKNYFYDKQKQYKINRSKKYTKLKTKKSKYIELHNKGYSKIKIAEIMNVSPSAVSKFFKRNNIE